VDTVLSVLDRAGIFVFALSGALLAVRVRFDVVGVVVLAIITGIGGGIAAAVCFALRLLAIHFRWQAPRASDLRYLTSQESGLERRRHAG